MLDSSYKKLFGLLLVLMVFVSVAGSGYAIADADKRVVFHINNPAKISHLVESVRNLKRVSPKAVVEVVFNGQSVVAVSRMGNQEKAVAELSKLDVRLGACTTAMLNHQVREGMLLEGIEYIRGGGVLRILELQEQGYSYIKI